MTPEQIASLLRHRKKIGFRVIGIEAWGRALVRPDDTSLELRDVSARGDLLVLQLDDVELALQDAGDPNISDDAIVFPSATYVRFDEVTVRPSGAKVRLIRGGKDETEFEARGAPALVLRKDPFV